MMSTKTRHKLDRLKGRLKTAWQTLAERMQAYAEALSDRVDDTLHQLRRRYRKHCAKR
jgi:hypothetical protein